MTKAQPIEHRVGRKRGLRAVAVGAALLMNFLIAALPAQAAPSGLPAAHPARMRLPVPTGRFPVGEVTLHLADTSRHDPWHPAQDDRELMVSVYYPTTRAAGRPTAPYMLPRAAAHFDSVTANDYLGMDVPRGRADWAATVTHAAQGAPVAHGHRKRPVLLYAPGLGEPRTWGTTLVSDLASRGYVVVTVDNTYESPEVEFPDGSLATMVTPGGPDAFIRKALTIRDADTSFVLDQLGSVDSGRNPDVDGRPLPRGLVGTLDLSRVGMFGHSLGGTATATAMDADPRISAGINMDGNLTNYDGTPMPVAEHGLTRPFLLMGKDGQTDTGPGWAAFRAHTPGWNRQLRLRGSEHASFTDAESLLPQLGLAPVTLKHDIGTIAPAAAVRTNEAYVSAFFDHWLRGTRGHLLDGPSPRYPDMEFVD
ncbi:dienelactone hydrolase [Streptomyces griseochromogenes]|uniref:Dienelactone hydrolase n=1 Tax=Streptomyces griseochromogenes TaxID=68214 RepID=A0A1B1AY94_9ACTN|nr:Tat pathway signal protein [Streptomyces griseochromogenes]ANP51492.1 Tat pathway signal protein [Streptomyces griseochromogenes]MBP2049744.1 dienelactone hydrolase [Streptomyces griseochromogenes]